MFNKKKLGALTSYNNKNDIFFPAINFNGIFKYNTKTKTVSCIEFSNHNIIDSFLFSGALTQIDNSLIVYPFLSNIIKKINLENNTTTYISIPPEIAASKYNKNVWFTTESSILFPANTNEHVLIHDLKTDTISVHNELSTLLSSLGSSEKNTICIDNNILFLYVAKKAIIYAIDLHTLKYDSFSVPTNDLIENIYFHDNTIWFTKHSSLEIESFNLDNLKKTTYIPNGIHWQTNMKISPYSNIIFYNNRIFVSSYYTEQIGEIDSTSKQINSFISINNSKNIFPFGGAFGSFEIINNVLYILPIMSDHGIQIDNNTVQTFELTIDNDTNSDFISAFHKKNIFFEEDPSDITEFLQYVEERHE